MSAGRDGRLSRRELLRAGAWAGLGASVLPRGLLASEASLPLITKPIPATGERLSVIGVGADQFGRMAYGDVRDMLKRMRKLGGTVIDTAAAYGDSEVQIGKALGELHQARRMFIATKLNAPGTSVDGTQRFVGGLESFERSLQRLRRLDLLFVHDIRWAGSMMPILEELKKKGRVRYIGVTSIWPEQYPQLIRYIREYPMDFLQINYALNERGAEAEILPLAQERRIAVMAAVPFGGDKNSLLAQVGDRQLPEWAADYDIASWGQFFLKYVVSHPAITCAIPGSSKLAHLEDNQAAGRGRLPDAAARRMMEDYWAGKA